MKTEQLLLLRSNLSICFEETISEKSGTDLRVNVGSMRKNPLEIRKSQIWKMHCNSMLSVSAALTLRHWDHSWWPLRDVLIAGELLRAPNILVHHSLWPPHVKKWLKLSWAVSFRNSAFSMVYVCGERWQKEAHSLCSQKSKLQVHIYFHSDECVL